MDMVRDSLYGPAVQDRSFFLDEREFIKNGRVTPDRDLDIFGDDFPLYSRWYSVNIRTGDSVELPIISRTTSSFFFTEVKFVDDGNRAIMVYGHKVPIPSCRDGGVRECSITESSILDIDLKAGEVSVVVDSGDAPSLMEQSNIYIQELGDGDYNVHVSRPNDPRKIPSSIINLRKIDGELRFAGVLEGGGAKEDIKAYIKEDKNTPPDIFMDNDRGESVRLTRINPDLDKAWLGVVESIEWSDGSGGKFKGGLLRPRGFREGERYPVVIQTYAYYEDKFLVNGHQIDVTNFFNARALASAGIMVLQAACGFDYGAESSVGIKTRSEAEQAMLCMEGAIDHLDEKGLIDRDRVGLSGWSRTDHHVLHMATFSDYPVNSIAISDGISTTPQVYTEAYGGFPGASAVDGNNWVVDDGRYFGGSGRFKGLIGALPVGGVDYWMKRSPFFNADRIQSAILFGAIGRKLPAHFDLYALMRRMKYPVEMIVIPDDLHGLMYPQGRMASQGIAFEWFLFWLKGEEIYAERNPQQYIRWRKLRELREKITSNGGL